MGKTTKYRGVSMFGQTGRTYNTPQEAVAAMRRKLKKMMAGMHASGQLPEARAVEV